MDGFFADDDSRYLARAQREQRLFFHQRLPGILDGFGGRSLVRAAVEQSAAHFGRLARKLKEAIE